MALARQRDPDVVRKGLSAWAGTDVHEITQPAAGGLSSETYLFAAGDRELVARLPPAGAALFREYNLAAQAFVMETLAANAIVPVPEVASANVTGDVAAAFPFEPYGTNAVAKGAKLLLAAKDMVDKSKINSDMLRNGLALNPRFIKEHPDLARKVVWAHMDAVEVMRRASAASGQSTEGPVSTDVLNSRRPTAKMPPLRRISSSFGESGTGS